MTDDLQTAVQILQDRQAILNCLTNYSRGVDRLDRELLLPTRDRRDPSYARPLVADPERVRAGRELRA